MDKCKFCESLESYKRSIKISNRQIDPEYGRLMQDITVAFVVRNWYEKIGTRRTCGRAVGFKQRGVGFKLNYCPECGRRLSRSKKDGIDQAINALRDQFKKDEANAAIYNPVAHALYETWKRFNKC